MIFRFIKRIFDVIFSLLAFIVLFPLLVIVSVLIKFDSKGPLLFTQKRVGKNKRTFTILKFRTMKIDTPKEMPTHMLSDPTRYITKLGLKLRKTSLDELPQLINIIKGDMSIVGPRPALWNQFDLISERDRYGANSIRPGLTGWAQVSGRDELDILTKAKLDGEYVKKMSVSMDIKCIYLTFKSVFSGKGVVEGGPK